MRLGDRPTIKCIKDKVQKYNSLFLKKKPKLIETTSFQLGSSESVIYT